MHREEIVIRKSNLLNLLAGERPVIAVGTTVLRSLESLYWYGVLLADDPGADFEISQDLPYREKQPQVSRTDALKLVLARLERSGKEYLIGRTSLYVMPGYRFMVAKGLITNFHQPGSSLLVLVSAFVGPGWKTVYQEALSKGYRFLSYGDSSLLLP
jgi:S-adenosylmethionine:tRNA ribosyltransferase-isomerase